MMRLIADFVWSLFHWHRIEYTFSKIVKDEHDKRTLVCMVITTWSRTWDMDQKREALDNETIKLKKDGWTKFYHHVSAELF